MEMRLLPLLLCISLFSRAYSLTCPSVTSDENNATIWGPRYAQRALNGQEDTDVDFG